MKRPLHLLALAAATSGCLTSGPGPTADELRDARRDAARPTPGATSHATAESRPRQPRVDGGLSLPQAVDHALAHNLALQGALLRRSEALGIVEQARGAALPDLGLTASATRDLTAPDETPETYATGIQLTQPLWRSGILAAGLRHARLNAAGTEAAIRQQVQATIATTTRLYFDVLLQQHLVAVYEEAAATAERMLATSRIRRKAGTVSDYEVLRAEVEISTAKADLLQARNTLQTSRLELLRELGAAQDSQFELTGTLAFETEQYDDDAAIRSALEHRPDLYQAEAALRMAEANVQVVRGEYGPALDAFVKGTYANPDPNASSRDGGADASSEGEWGDDWTVGASLSLTLFDGMARRGRMRQAESKAGQANAALRDAEETARVEVVKALLDLHHAAELYESQQKNLELAHEALRMVDSGFHMGRSTQVEVLDAQSALTEAMGRYYNAIHAHCVARLAVRQALGLLEPDPMASRPSAILPSPSLPQNHP